MLVVSIIAATLVVTEQGWFNGGQGLFGIPQPFASSLSLTISRLRLVLRRHHARLIAGRAPGSSPRGSRLTVGPAAAGDAGERRGGRVPRHQVPAGALKVYVIGGAIAAVSGGLLVEFIGAWSPAAWGTGETFIYFVAIIVGGLGQQLRRVVRCVPRPRRVPRTAHLPAADRPTPTPRSRSSRPPSACYPGCSCWWRPQGIFPERRRQLSRLIRGRRGRGGPAARPGSRRRRQRRCSPRAARARPRRGHAVGARPGASTSAACTRWTGSPSSWRPVRSPA